MAEVEPGWVLRDDEGDLLYAEPAFDLFFTGDGLLDELEAFEVDEAVNFVAGSEGLWVGCGLVFADADFKVAGYAGVEVVEGVGENVDVLVVILHEVVRPPGRLLQLREEMTEARATARAKCGGSSRCSE